jgi:chromosomal replication initiator protein
MLSFRDCLLWRSRRQGQRVSIQPKWANCKKLLIQCLTVSPSLRVDNLSTTMRGPQKVMENDKAWQKILSSLKDQVSPANYRTWFSQTALGQINKDSLTIKVPSAFIKGQLINRYESLIRQAAAETIGEEGMSILYEIDPSLLSKKSASDKPIEDIFELSSAPVQSQAVILNPKYTLDGFVVGLTNNLAFAAAQAVAQNPGTSYNPLFIYGPSGVGKTHLMQGIGNALLAKNPYLKVVYAPSERFMNDFVDSIQTKATGSFRQKYRSCDILLIDDIQFISGKDSTQEEFFHTYNDLHAKNAQLIFTSDRPPNEIQKLESRLLSRFQGGLMVDIQLPDFDTRMAILKSKLEEKGESLSEDILKSLAENIQSNTRELEGKLVQILQISKLTGKEIDEAMIGKIIGVQTAAVKQSIDHKKVISSINNYFNVKVSDLTGPRRQKEFVLPRQIAMFLMYEECRLPMERIGEILGGRDHTTVLHGIEKIRTAVQRDREIQRAVIEVKNNLSA